MNKVLARARVIVTALPTRLVAAAAVISFALPLVADSLPEHAEQITLWGGRIVVWLGAAVAIIRKVTPVAPEQVGILPQGPPSSPIVHIDTTPPVDIPGGEHTTPQTGA